MQFGTTILRSSIVSTPFDSTENNMPTTLNGAAPTDLLLPLVVCCANPWAMNVWLEKTRDRQMDSVGEIGICLRGHWFHLAEKDNNSNGHI